jgi:hypothetical protein
LAKKLKNKASASSYKTFLHPGKFIPPACHAGGHRLKHLARKSDYKHYQLKADKHYQLKADKHYQLKMGKRA